MDWHFRWTTGLTFGIEQEEVFLIDDEDDEPPDEPVTIAAINIHLGFFRVILMFF
jgi:hypothetical protein